MRARIEVPGHMPAKGTVVELDGQDIAGAIYRLALDLSVGEINQLRLDMHVIEGVYFDGEVEVGVDERAARLLVALGWTPPFEGAARLCEHPDALETTRLGDRTIRWFCNACYHTYYGEIEEIRGVELAAYRVGFANGRRAKPAPEPEGGS